MNDSSLEYADLSGLTILNRKLCSTCGALKEIRLDSVTNITTGTDQHHFERCNSIENVYLTSMTRAQVSGHSMFPFDIPEARLDAVRFHCSDGLLDGRGTFIPDPRAPSITSLYPRDDGPIDDYSEWMFDGINAIAGSNLSDVELSYKLEGFGAWFTIDPSRITVVSPQLIHVDCSGLTDTHGRFILRAVNGFGTAARNFEYW